MSSELRISLPDQLRGRSITTKIIPTVANLKNMLAELNEVCWQEERLSNWK